MYGEGYGRVRQSPHPSLEISLHDPGSLQAEPSVAGGYTQSLEFPNKGTAQLSFTPFGMERRLVEFGGIFC